MDISLAKICMGSVSLPVDFQFKFKFLICSTQFLACDCFHRLQVREQYYFLLV